jgi:hypothetical protein
MANSTGLDDVLTTGTTHYNGAITLLFDDLLHAYTVEEEGQRYLVPGVTTVLEMIDKPALMQWAANSTVAWLLAKFPANDDLRKILLDAYERVKTKIPWDDLDQYFKDVQLSISAAELAKLCNEARFNYRAISKDATDVGHAAHEWLEILIKRHLSGERGFHVVLPTEDRAKRCVQAALNWMGKHNFKPLSSERKLYSRKYSYAGTMDWDGMVTGCGDPKCCGFSGEARVLGDFKSSNGLYDEYRMQLAAYLYAVEEEFPDEHHTAGIILRLGKDTGDFDTMVMNREEMETDFNGFLGTLQMYHWQKQLDITKKYAKLDAKAADKAEKLALKTKEKEEKAALKALTPAVRRTRTRKPDTSCIEVAA